MKTEKQVKLVIHPNNNVNEDDNIRMVYPLHTIEDLEDIHTDANSKNKSK